MGFNEVEYINDKSSTSCITVGNIRMYDGDKLIHDIRHTPNGIVDVVTNKTLKEV